MAVVIETTLGDITVDLYLEQRPVTCLNFLKLCKMKYYNFNLFHTIRSGFIAQTGDPTGEGSGGQSVFGILEGPDKRFFSAEKMPKIRHTDAGLISMVGTGDMMVGSQFFFTLAPDLDSLDGLHCVIGEVTEGHDVLRKLNDVICDEGHRPYRDVRITHTVVLEDPFNDPLGLRAPSRSPSPSAERLKGGRIAPDEDIDETQGKTVAEIQEMIEEKEAKARATILEIVGDLPDADIAPPENVLFVCKLNPVTNDDDLEIIFSRFGKIVSCEVIRDKKTGDSLQYAFIEFADKKSCEDAYFKMDNVLIDDRRIHVDFSQSVSKMKWLGKGRGVKYFDENDDKSDHIRNDKPRQRSRSRDDKPRQRSRSRDRSNRNHHSDRNNHSNVKRHENRERERHSDRHHRHEINSTENSHRHRSRSRSRLDRSKDEGKNDRNRHSYDHNRNSERSKKEYKETSHGTRESPYKNNKDRHRHENEKNRKDKSFKDSESSKAKRKIRDVEVHKNSKKSKSNNQKVEPRTPSPVIEKKKEKKSVKQINKSKRASRTKLNIKKKRKPSTSSSDSSSESSSSSTESSSTSEEDKKKKTLKRRKKKYSTSSTSSSSSSESSSSSSSSSSESSSSSSSTSDGDSKKKKKSKKNEKKKL